MSPRFEHDLDSGGWYVSCCDQTWTFFNPLERSTLHSPVRFGDERTAAQFLVEHLHSAHGVDTVRGVVVVDVQACAPWGMPCSEWDADAPCSACGGTGMLSQPRPLTPEGTFLTRLSGWGALAMAVEEIDASSADLVEAGHG